MRFGRMCIGIVYIRPGAHRNKKLLPIGRESQVAGPMSAAGRNLFNYGFRFSFGLEVAICVGIADDRISVRYIEPFGIIAERIERHPEILMEAGREYSGLLRF